MKKLLLSTLATCIVAMAFAQQPRGNRVLAWQIDMAENNSFDSAYAYGKVGCMESVHTFFTWSLLEPDANGFDATAIANTLDILNIYFPIVGDKIELQLAPINTVAKETPTDLLTVNFDDPQLIARFKILLDTFFAHIPDVELTALNIGNEHDVFMGTDAIQYAAYKVFLDSVAPYAQQLYANLHNGEALKVGTTFTFHGLTDPATAGLCQSVNVGRDIVPTTYYPLNGDFTAKPPTVVSTDFADLVALYSDTTQPIYFVECGYPSSPTCNSSEAQQAQFYQEVFAAWDTFEDNIPYLTIFKSTDWSQQEVIAFGQYYGVTSPEFLEFLRSLGVRTWSGNGSDKLAYNAILCALEERNWCSVTCPTVGVADEAQDVQVTLYPNPTQGNVTIESSERIQELRIFSLEGKLVHQTAGASFNASSFPRGYYTVQIEFDNQKTAKRTFIKT